MSDEPLSCRICHESHEPLYYPCRCTGSIALVHSECLRRWMGVNKHESCEVCGARYSFHREYSADVPTSKYSAPVLFHLLCEFITSALNWILYILLVVVLFWLLPVTTFLEYRFCFLLACGAELQLFSDPFWPLEVWLGGLLQLVCVMLPLTSFIDGLVQLIMREILLGRRLARMIPLEPVEVPPVPVPAGPRDISARELLSLSAWVAAHIAVFYAVMFLLPGLTGRGVCTSLHLHRLLWTTDHSYAAALQRWIRSKESRSLASLLLLGTFRDDSGVDEGVALTEALFLFLRVVEHLCVGYALVGVIAGVVCLFNRYLQPHATPATATLAVEVTLEPVPTAAPAAPVPDPDPPLTEGGRGGWDDNIIRDCLGALACVGLTVPLITHFIKTAVALVHPTHRSMLGGVLIALYLIVAVTGLVHAAGQIAALFRPEWKQRAISILDGIWGSKSYTSLVGGIAAVSCVALGVYGAVILLPAHYGHYLCPLAGPIDLQFTLPSLLRLMSCIQFFTPLLSGVSVSSALVAVLRLYVTAACHVLGLQHVLAPPPPEAVDPLQPAADDAADVAPEAPAEPARQPALDPEPELPPGPVPEPAVDPEPAAALPPMHGPPDVMENPVAGHSDDAAEDTVDTNLQPQQRRARKGRAADATPVRQPSARIASRRASGSGLSTVPANSHRSSRASRTRTPQVTTTPTDTDTASSDETPVVTPVVALGPGLVEPVVEPRGAAPQAPTVQTADENVSQNPPQQQQQQQQQPRATLGQRGYDRETWQLLSVLVGGFLPVTLYSAWVHRASLVVGRWVAAALLWGLGPSCNEGGPDWESDLLAFFLGLSVCANISQFLHAMVWDAAEAAAQARSQGGAEPRFFWATVCTAVGAAYPRLGYWLRQGARVLVAALLWLPCISYLPGALVHSLVPSFLLRGDQVVQVHDVAFVALRVGYCFAQAALSFAEQFRLWFGICVRLIKALGVRDFMWSFATQQVVYPVLLFLLDALLPAVFLAHCAALYASFAKGSDHTTVLYAYRLGHWLGCAGYCLARLAVWGGQYALRRLDTLHQEVRDSDKYLRSERLLNRDEAGHESGADH